MVTTSRELIDVLGQSSRDQVAAFCASCATRLGPVFATFSRTTGGEQFERWLRELWSLIESLNTRRARDLASQVATVPEAHADDSNQPDYYAMRALSILAYAIQTVVERDPLKPALWCSDAAISLLEDLDFVLNTPGDSGGSLAELELHAEQGWIAEFSGEPSAPFGERGFEAARASDVFRHLPELLGEVARRRHWDVA